MPTDGYMDAAAVPVPDAGDDTLREQLTWLLIQHCTIPRYDEDGTANWDLAYCPTCGAEGLYGPNSPDQARHQADALLPRIREHTAAAWDEGWRAGQGDEFEAREGREREESANPYRDVIEQSVMREGIADAIMLTSHNGMDCGPDPTPIDDVAALVAEDVVAPLLVQRNKAREVAVHHRRRAEKAEAERDQAKKDLRSTRFELVAAMDQLDEAHKRTSELADRIDALSADVMEREAAIERLLARCETAGTTQPPFGQPAQTLTVADIRAALDGQEAADA